MDKTTTEQSVEQALAELREMFPHKIPRNKNGRTIYIEINQTARSGRSPDGDFEFRSKARIHIEYALGGYSAPLVVTADTLNQAMTEIRQWHAEQAKES